MPVEFLDDKQLPKPDSFTFNVPENLDSPDAVFSAFAAGLSAPNAYFGSNWDAFNDCLMDLQWIKQREVVIAHQRIPQLRERDLAIYLRTLSIACSSWGDDKTKQLAEQFDDFVPHSLRVLFPIHCQSVVSATLHN